MDFEIGDAIEFKTLGGFLVCGEIIDFDENSDRVLVKTRSGEKREISSKDIVSLI